MLNVFPLVVYQGYITGVSLPQMEASWNLSSQSLEQKSEQLGPVSYTYLNRLGFFDFNGSSVFSTVHLLTASIIITCFS